MHNTHIIKESIQGHIDLYILCFEPYNSWCIILFVKEHTMRYTSCISFFYLICYSLFIHSMEESKDIYPQFTNLCNNLVSGSTTINEYDTKKNKTESTFYALKTLSENHPDAYQKIIANTDFIKNILEKSPKAITLAVFFNTPFATQWLSNYVLCKIKCSYEHEVEKEIRTRQSKLVALLINIVHWKNSDTSLLENILEKGDQFGVWRGTLITDAFQENANGKKRWIFHRLLLEAIIVSNTTLATFLLSNYATLFKPQRKLSQIEGINFDFKDETLTLLEFAQSIHPQNEAIIALLTTYSSAH